MTNGLLTRYVALPWRRAYSLASGVTLMLSLSGILSPAYAQDNLPPAQSYRELHSRLKVGDTLIVRDADGRTTTGRVSTLGSDQFEVEWRRFLRLRHRTFTEPGVRRVQVRDSTWNGVLIGLGVGIAGTIAVCANDTSGGGACLMFVILGPTLGIAGGAGIDGSINRRIYEAPGRATTTVAPVIGPGRIGLAARVRF